MHLPVSTKRHAGTFPGIVLARCIDQVSKNGQYGVFWQVVFLTRFTRAQCPKEAARMWHDNVIRFDVCMHSRHCLDNPCNEQLSRHSLLMFIIPPFWRPLPRNGYDGSSSTFVCIAYSWMQVESYSLCMFGGFWLLVLVWVVSPAQNNYYDLHRCGHTCSWIIPCCCWTISHCVHGPQFVCLFGC